MCSSDVDEVLVVELVVLPEEVHIGSDLGGAGPLNDEREVGGQSGFVTGKVQHRTCLHLGVQTDVNHPMLPELDGHLPKNPSCLIQYPHVTSILSTFLGHQWTAGRIDPSRQRISTSEMLSILNGGGSWSVSLKEI